MNSKAFILLVSVSCVFVGALPAVADPPPSRLWKVGDMWNLQVELPDKTTFITHAMAGGVESVKGSPCWQLTFLPGDVAPEHLKHKRLRVLTDQKTGWPIRALWVSDKQDIPVTNAGPASFVTGLPDGMPLELFNPADLPTGKADIPGTNRRIEVRKEDKADHYFVEMALFDNNVEEWRVRQQWVEGEKWWHTYERTVKGQKTLTARRMNAPPFKSAVAAKKDQDPAILAARFPLRMVPELRRKVPMVGAGIQLADLLEHLRSVTGLKMTLADNLTYHEPKFTELQGGRDATGWIVMGIIAATDLDDGRWEKTADGYRLEGVSRALRPPPPAPPTRFPWGWVFAALGMLVLTAGAFLIYRQRGKTAAATSTDP